MSKSDSIPIIDLFAGPGGLGEGFCRLESKGKPVFRIALSIEMEEHAHRTLTLRSFLRQYWSRGEDVPGEYYDYLRGNEKYPTLEAILGAFPREGTAARDEAWRATLGSEPSHTVSKRIRAALARFPRSKPWVLIGGPPCQAYSLVGRARMLGTLGRKFYEDHRHTLYTEYLRIIRAHAPSVFVMENVKGLLSSKLNDALVLTQILRDLRTPKSGVQYDLVSLTGESRGLFDHSFDRLAADPSQFVVESERFGIPQRRHRIIIVGVRRDFALTLSGALSIPQQRNEFVKCASAIDDLPRLRSGLSKEADTDDDWTRRVGEAASSRWLRQLLKGDQADVAAEVLRALGEVCPPRQRRGQRYIGRPANPGFAHKWLFDARLGGVINHESRSHIAPDLHRYIYAAAFGRTRHKSPKIRDFPSALYPHHLNIYEAVESRMFNDRFRVQVTGEPATTVTAHIAKDGHYFIHPDPTQVRSLTVREAARLQTFPDNYFFEGPRTEQYRQVGNAVPPLLAHRIAGAVAAIIDPSHSVPE